MELLALIGLIVILWFVGKAFTKIGNSLDSMADSMADRYISPKHIRKAYEMEQKADSIKKDDNFEETVQGEIDQLEKLMNEKGA